MQRYKLITFDVTGTLLKFSHPPGVHYARTGALYGIKADPNVLTISFNKQWKHLNSCKPNFGVKHHGWEHWWNEAVQRTFINAGINCDKQILENISKQLIDTYTTSSCWQHCEGATYLLTKLKNESIPIGILSNFDTRVHKILKNMDLNHYFDFILSSYEVGHSKPDKKIFEAALEYHPSLRPSDVLHVGDTADVDRTGALNAGWNSWLIRDDPQSSPTTNQTDLQNLSGTFQQLHDHLFPK